MVSSKFVFIGEIKKMFFPLLYIIILSACSISNAQEKETVKYLTMENAISMALNNNNIIKSNRYGIEKASWDVKRAWAQLFPKISFNTTYSWIDRQTFAERDFRQYLPPELSDQIPQTVFQESYRSTFDLYFPLFNGVLINGLSIAYEQENLTENQTRSVEHQTVYNVIASYLNVLRNKEIYRIQNEFLELSRLNYEKAQRLYEANRYSQNEALRWKIDYQQQKSVLANSAAELRSSILSLSRLINTELDSSIIIDPKVLTNLDLEQNKILGFTDKEILKIIDLSNEELIKANASLAALKSGEEISRLTHKNSYSSFMPNINLNYSYGWRENNTIDFDDYSPKTLLINFSLPIFSGFQNYSAYKSSLYEYKQNQEQFKDQLLNTKIILNDVANNIINIKTQIDLLKTNLEISKNNYSIVERQRERGLVSNIDYIDAKLNVQNANIDYIGNNYNFMIAIAELYYLTGKIESLIY
jgi:outer membrane protein TolC